MVSVLRGWGDGVGRLDSSRQVRLGVGCAWGRELLSAKPSRSVGLGTVRAPVS